MSGSFKLELTKEIVETDVNRIRCVVCDSIDRNRVQYPCGHRACAGCISSASECVKCVTSTSDHNQTNDSSSLPTFETNIGSFQGLQKQRLSERQKIERELFPQCIQAEQKYFNRRKTICSPAKKHRQSRSQNLYPGETVTLFNPSSSKMNQSIKYVSKWLEQNEKVQLERSPLVDINVNSPKSGNLQKNIDKKNHSKLVADKSIHVDNVNKKNRAYNATLNSLRSRNLSLKRSQSYCKGKKSKSQPKEETISKRLKNIQSEKLFTDNTEVESETILEDDDPIIIEDSQDYLDKDKQALQAVLAASENENALANTTVNKTSEFKKVDEFEVKCTKNFTQKCTKPNEFVKNKEVTNSENTKAKNVPFYYKFRHKTDDGVPQPPETIDLNPTENVSINIKRISNTSTITIKITDSKNEICDKAVQTDKTEDYNTLNVCKQSGDLFSDSIACKDLEMNRNMKRGRNAMDTDSESDKSEIVLTMTTVADVHATNDLHSENILTPLEENAAASRGMELRKRRLVASSDSSDKENRDPNVPKKKKATKGKKSLKNRQKVTKKHN